MTKHPNDPWFPIAAMLVVVLTIWLGIAGPLLDDVTAKGLIGLAKGWQTLIVGCIAIGTAVVASHNVTRQLRMQAKIREEDRMEAALPGLREAQDLLERLLSDLRSPRGMEFANNFIRARPITPDGIRRALPSADERMRREVASVMLLLRMVSQPLALAFAEHRAARDKLRDISNFAPAEHDGLHDLERKTREAIVLHTRSMEGAISSLERLVMTYNKRTERYVELLTKFRREIEAFWDND